MRMLILPALILCNERWQLELIRSTTLRRIFALQSRLCKRRYVATIVKRCKARGTTQASDKGQKWKPQREFQKGTPRSKSETLRSAACRLFLHEEF